jgi:hypothetical protein
MVSVLRSGRFVRLESLLLYRSAKVLKGPQSKGWAGFSMVSMSKRGLVPNNMETQLSSLKLGQPKS